MEPFVGHSEPQNVIKYTSCSLKRFLQIVKKPQKNSASGKNNSVKLPFVENFGYNLLQFYPKLINVITIQQ